MNKPPLSPMTEDDVLFAFSVEPDHSRATLEAYLALYPHYSGPLVQLAVELQLAQYREPMMCAADAPAIDRAWAVYQSAAPLETKSIGTAESLLAALPPAAFRAIAESLDVNSFFLSLVRDRAIAFGTIPFKFLTKLAGELNATINSLTGDLQQPSMVAAGQKFKADKKPEATAQITFTEALTTSHLTEQQQAKLKALME
jgi:hypothetical protein